MTQAPSCNGSQQESQKLTGDSARETPRTDAALERFAIDGAFAIFPLMRQLERELNAKSRELEEARKDAERWQLVRECVYMDSHRGQGLESWTVEPGSPHRGEAVKIAFTRAIDSALHHDGK